jgi:hypothetical protein
MGGDAPRVDCECVCVLNIPRYIFIVRRLSILSKLDSNKSYRIWTDLYLPNLNYLIILDTWPIWPSWRPRRSRFTSWSYLSFRRILFVAHLLVWPSYGDNSIPWWYEYCINPIKVLSQDVTCASNNSIEEAIHGVGLKIFLLSSNEKKLSCKREL